MCSRYLFSFLLIFPVAAYAQQTLRGKMFDERTDSVLAGVTIYNLTRNTYAVSATDGSYAVTAMEADKIIFSSVGYRSDTLRVVFYMFQAGYDVTLKTQNNTLKSVTVIGSYQADSLRRRQEYSDIYEKPKARLPRGNVPSGGFGVTVNPVIFQSEKEKQKQRLKKLLISEEEEAFVDYTFSRSYVSRVTGLRGDSLQVFMHRYRPSYSFCRSAAKVDMLVYINDKLKLFKNEETPVKK